MRSYSFQNTTLAISWNDEKPLLITGWAEGDDVIHMKRRSPSVTDSMGVSGEMMVSHLADHSGEIIFRLQQVSPSNALLMSMLHKQEHDHTNSSLSITFTDAYRGDKASCTQGCYIKKFPDIVRGAKASTVEWTIVVEDLYLLLGE